MFEKLYLVLLFQDQELLDIMLVKLWMILQAKDNIVELPKMQIHLKYFKLKFFYKIIKFRLGQPAILDGGNGSLSARPNADDNILLLFFGSKY